MKGASWLMGKASFLLSAHQLKAPFIKTTVDISLDSQNLHHHHRNRGWRDVYRWKLFFFLISRGSFLSFILCCIEERKRWHLSFWWSSSNWLGATEEGWKDTPNQWENHLKETSPDKPALFPFIFPMELAYQKEGGSHFSNGIVTPQRKFIMVLSS